MSSNVLTCTYTQQNECITMLIKRKLQDKSILKDNNNNNNTIAANSVTEQ